jgi:hypothetical protein
MSKFSLFLWGATAIIAQPSSEARAQSEIASTISKTDAFFNALTNVCDGNPTAALTRKGFAAQLRPGAIFKKKIDTLESTDLEKLNQGILRKYKISYFVSNPTYLRRYDTNGLSQWVNSGNNGGMLGANAGDFQANLTAQMDALSRALGGGSLAGTDFIMDRELSAGLTVIDFEYQILSDGSVKLVALSGDKSSEVSAFQRSMDAGIKYGKRDCSLFINFKGLLADVVTFGLSRGAFVKSSSSIRTATCARSDVQSLRNKWVCNFSIAGRRNPVQNLSLNDKEKSIVIDAIKNIDQNNLLILSDSKKWGDFESEALSIKATYLAKNPNIMSEYESGIITDSEFINRFYEKDLIVSQFLNKTNDVLRRIVKG